MMNKEGTERNDPDDRLPKGGRPTRDAAARLGEPMLDIALDHFCRQGYEGASMDAIAADAHVSKRTLYQRYGSKRGLLVAVTERQRVHYLQLIELSQRRGSTRQQLTRTARAILDAALLPKSLAFAGLKVELEKLGMNLDDGTQRHVFGSWISALRAILTAEQTLANATAEHLDAMATMIFDLLVTIPLTRITVRRDLPDTSAAKSAHAEQSLDFFAQGFPFLVQTGPAETVDSDIKTKKSNGKSTLPEPESDH